MSTMSSHSYLIQPRNGMRAHGTFRVVVDDGVVTSAFQLSEDGTPIPVGDLGLDADGLLVHVEIDHTPITAVSA